MCGSGVGIEGGLFYFFKPHTLFSNPILSKLKSETSPSKAIFWSGSAIAEEKSPFLFSTKINYMKFKNI
jgi:hypothetical protein